MKNPSEYGNSNKEDRHRFIGLLERVKVEYFDSSHADRSGDNIVKYPVLVENSQDPNTNCEDEAYQITPPNEFYHSFLEFFDEIEALIAAQKEARNRHDNSRIANYVKSYFRIFVRHQLQ